MAPISLLNGWAPIALQVIAAAALVVAVGWRTPRWRGIGLPVSIAVGVVAVAVTYWYIHWAALASGRAAPITFWVWVALSGLAVGVLGFRWRGSQLWRRCVSILAVPLCVACAALGINAWTGYVPSVQSAWHQLTGDPLPGQTDEATAAAMQARGAMPNGGGTIVPVTIPDTASGFPHRDEFVYLPPAWYASDPPPRLPVVMMIGAEFGTPSDWLRTGGAKKTVDDLAAAHGGNAPLLVFVDATGKFSNDTGCVNGRRGNSADHLTEDVVPYMISHFGASADPANWGIAGWSVGGTCAVTLTVKYPELFSAFVDIDGDLFPNAGFENQTIARLFDGDVDAFRAFDPASTMAGHGRYQGTAGWFAVSNDPTSVYHDGVSDPGDPGARPAPADTPAVANYLCAVASRNGIECSVVGVPTQHDWPSAAKVFADSLPWLAGKIGVPGVPPVPLPGAPAP